MPSRISGGMNRFARVGDDSDTPSDTPIAVGTAIEADYKGEGVYYAGAVTAGPEADGSYTVRYYDDGVVEAGVPRARIRVTDDGTLPSRPPPKGNVDVPPFSVKWAGSDVTESETTEGKFSVSLGEAQERAIELPTTAPDPLPPDMVVHVRMLSGEDFALDIAADDALATLKVALEPRVGVPPAQQRLFLPGSAAALTDEAATLRAPEQGRQLITRGLFLRQAWRVRRVAAPSRCRRARGRG